MKRTYVVFMDGRGGGKLEATRDGEYDMDDTSREEGMGRDESSHNKGI